MPPHSKHLLPIVLTAASGCQAMIEGLGILLTRTTAPPPAPVMMPEMGSAGPSAPGTDTYSLRDYTRAVGFAVLMHCITA